MALQKSDFYKTDAYLTNIVKGIVNEEYIADQILPIVKVKKDSGSIYTRDATHLVDRGSTMQAGPGTKTPRGDFGMGTAVTYAIGKYKYAIPVPDDVYDNADSPLDPKRFSAEIVNELHLLRKELALSAFMTVNTNFTNNATPNPKWDAANATPVADIKTAILTLQLSGCKKPNAAMMDLKTWYTLKFHTDIQGWLGYHHNTREVTQELFKALFELKYLFIGTANYRTTVGGTNAAVWDDDFHLFHYDPKPKVNFTWCLGYTLTRLGKRVDRWYEQDEEQEVIRQRDDWDQLILDETANYILYDVHT